jgi:hypothetical protein
MIRVLTGGRMAVVSDVTMGFLLHAANHSGKSTFEGVAGAVLGRAGYRSSYFCLIVLQVRHATVSHHC